MTTSAQHLDAVFSALADPTRRALLARLAKGEASVMDLAAPFALSQPAISKHLKVLMRAGLISRSREAQVRPCQIKAQPLKEVANWVEEYRGLWETRLDQLDEYLQSLQKQKKHSTKTKKDMSQ